MRLGFYELLTQFPDWLTRNATMIGCTSSHEIVRMALKEIFPNEDATRFDLVEELYSLPQKPPTTMHTFAAWLEDWVTKLVAADEISAYVEPRRAMAVLSHVGKPLQASDTLLMTEWVAIFRESGLRDDVSVENLREACLQLVVCARARARELQVDVQVERASRAVKPLRQDQQERMSSRIMSFGDSSICWLRLITTRTFSSGMISTAVGVFLSPSCQPQTSVHPSSSA